MNRRSHDRLDDMLLLTYALALWLGLYLIRLGSRDAGAGLVAYALGLLGGAPGVWLIVPAACWLAAVWRLRGARGRGRWLLVAGSVFLALSLGAFLLPFLPRDLTLLVVGFDLLLVGYAVAVLDAHTDGEVFVPGALRSLAGSALAAGVFGAQVGFVIVIEGPSLSLRALLVGVVSVSVAGVVFAPWINSTLDRLLLPRPVRDARATLRDVGERLPRASDLPSDPDAFVKHTRRALSHLNRPDKLAASPLMQLPHLQAETPLERAAELRALLVERIHHLKPEQGTYGTTDAWRYFNALYYPYVVGVKPYSVRYTPDDPDEDVRAVLEWMRTQVPERTLYNWQNAAAELIAHDLQASPGSDCLKPGIQTDQRRTR